MCALLATLIIGLGTPGSANVISRSDVNDTKHPLDPARLKVLSRWQGVFFAAGRFRGVLVEANGTVITYDEVAVRAPPRSVKVTWALAGIVEKGSYDFAAFSIFVGSPCSRKSLCVDAIPNRSSLIRHDFT